VHKFVVKKDGELFTYTRYEDIPLDFDHIIEFNPSIPPDPHTEEQHKEIEQWPSRLEKLMEIERASSN
jgi:hypothetical protein|tara:strand:- start:344 stop:547 length:204 start_codon:yes stop_codon:yes gene_type:complete